MISLDDVQSARVLLRCKVIHTPLVYSPTFSKMTGMEVYLKLENLQKTGSFKLRGATVKIESSLHGIGPRGVVAASAGNHAQGVALAAARAGFPSVIVMPEWASITKQEATRGYGGQVILEGGSVGESILKARELAEEGRVFVHPFDDPDIVRGQGTIALEVMEDLPDLDAILVPVGGGGLISGIAIAVKALKPGAAVVGVQAAACPSVHRAMAQSRIVRVGSRASLADGISVKEVGALTFPIIRDKVDDIVLVEEDRIAEALLMLLERKKVLAEGAGAVPLAALVGGSVSMAAGSKVVLVISGGNVDSPILDRVIRKGLVRNGRIMRLSVCLDDVPGALAGLLAVIGRMRANVFHIRHDRIGRDLPVFLTRVELEIETRGEDHNREICRRLDEAGYNVQYEPADRGPC